jgi:hypothetical protein
LEVFLVLGCYGVAFLERCERLAFVLGMIGFLSQVI